MPKDIRPLLPVGNADYLRSVPRMLRTDLPDGYFHVFARGVAGTAVFRDDEDRRSFLALFAAAVRRYRWDLYALCLMTTHYHVVLETTCARLSRGMQWLNGIYAQDFNKRYARHGHLFGGRFGCRTIEGEDYLHVACEYVLQNPVRAGLCDNASDWPWNGARQGFLETPKLVERTLVRSDPPG